MIGTRHGAAPDSAETATAAKSIIVAFCRANPRAERSMRRSERPDAMARDLHEPGRGFGLQTCPEGAEKTDFPNELRQGHPPRVTTRNDNGPIRSPDLFRLPCESTLAAPVAGVR